MNKSDISLFIIGVLYATVGIIFLAVPADTIIKFIFILLGVVLIVFNSLIFIDSVLNLKQDKKYYIVMTLSLIQIVMGIIVIIAKSDVLLIITGAILLLLSGLEIISAKDKKEQFKLDITKITLGIIFIILGATDAAKYVFIAMGIISIIFGAIYLVTALIISIVKDEVDNEDNNIYRL